MDRRAFIRRLAAMAVNQKVVLPSEKLSPAAKRVVAGGVNQAGAGTAVPTATTALPMAAGAASDAAGEATARGLFTRNWLKRFASPLETVGGRHNATNAVAGGTIGFGGGLLLGDEPGAVVGGGLGAMGGRGTAALARRLSKVRHDFGSNKYLAPGVAGGVGGTAAGGSLVLGSPGHNKMTKASLDNILAGSMADAVEALAKMAADLRTRPRTYAEKVAAGAADFLSSLGDSVKNNPALSHALVGGGLGAAAGGINTALNNRGKDENSRKSTLSGLLGGGLAGAAVGGGVGMARTGLANMKQTGGISGGMGSDALKPGQFADPTTGQTMMIDPKALKENPDLHNQVRSLTKPTLQTTVAGGVAGLYEKMREQAPTTTGLLPWVAGADLALHGPGFGLARTTADRVGGHAGQKWLSEGIGGLDISDKLKKAITNNAKVGKNKGGLITAIPGYAPPAAKGRLAKLWDRIAGNGNGKYGVRDILGGRANSSTGTDDVLKIKSPKTREVDKARYDAKTGKPLEKWKETEKVMKKGRPPLLHGTRPVMERESLNDAHIATAKNVAAKNDPHFEGRSIFRVPGTNRVYRGMGSFGGAVGLRAGLYGVPMAAEYVGRGIQEDVKSKESLRELMARHAKPVPEGK